MCFASVCLPWPITFALVPFTCYPYEYNMSLFSCMIHIFGWDFTGRACFNQQTKLFSGWAGLRPALDFGRCRIRVLGGPCQWLIMYFVYSQGHSVDGSGPSGIGVPSGGRVHTWPGICVCRHAETSVLDQSIYISE